MPPARYNVARFFFRRRSRVFFSSFLNNPARERNLHKRALLLRNIGHFSTIPSAHISSSIRPLSPRQRLSIAVLANDACRASRPTPNPFARDSPSKPPLERERERLGPVKSLEELAIRSNYGTRPSVSTTLFSPFRFTNLEHQLIPGKTKLSARIPEEHPTTFLLCPPRSRGRLDVRSKLIRPWKERERYQGARSREHNSTRKRTEGDLISMLILPSHRGPSVFTVVSVARSPPPPRRGIADYGLEPVGPHGAWRPRRGGKEANKYRAIGCSFF